MGFAPCRNDGIGITCEPFCHLATYGVPVDTNNILAIAKFFVVHFEFYWIIELMRSNLMVGRLGMPFLVLVLVLFVLILPNSRRSMGGQSLREKDYSLAKKVMVTQKCGSCHALRGHDLNWDATIGPDLTNASSRQRSPAWLRQYIRVPESISEDELDVQYNSRKGIMPSFAHLSSRELEAIVHFLMTAREEVP